MNRANGPTSSGTTALASTWSMPTSCLASSSDCIGRKTMKEPVSAWPSCSELSIDMAVVSGLKLSPTAVQRSTLPWKKEKLSMNDKIIEILLVEDNLDDVKLALHAFETNSIANSVQVIRDGAEALEFIFC